MIVRISRISRISRILSAAASTPFPSREARVRSRAHSSRALRLATGCPATRPVAAGQPSRHI